MVSVTVIRDNRTEKEIATMAIPAIAPE